VRINVFINFVDRDQRAAATPEKEKAIRKVMKGTAFLRLQPINEERERENFIRHNMNTR